MDDLLMAEPKAPKAKKKKKRGGLGQPAAKAHGVNVHVNVINQSGDGHKKPQNQADEALRNLRGY